MDASTSLGVWQPKYILENPMERNANIHRNFVQNFLVFERQREEQAGSALRMPAGKRVACGAGDGAFYRMEVRIQHPGSWDTEGDL